ncbi:MAG TPA: nitrate transporter, partial [Methylomirabilota bacterium]|nr:nitrate transporter [Methylomirabilota bacterium]
SNRKDLAAILARDAYVGQNADLMMPALTGEVRLGLGAVVSEPDFFLPFVRAATFPWKSHALWFYSQMVRWGHARWSPQNARLAADAFRPDLYRAAFRRSGVSLPAASSKVEGALTHSVPAGSSGGDLMLGPDGFFDSAVFDPEEVEEYVTAQRRLDTADAAG